MKIVSYVLFAVSLFFGYLAGVNIVVNEKIEKEMREVQNKYNSFNLTVVSVYIEDTLEFKYDEFRVTPFYKVKMVSNFNDTLILNINEIDGRYKEIIGKVFTYNNPSYIELAELGIIKPIRTKKLETSLLVFGFIISLILSIVAFIGKDPFPNYPPGGPH